MTSPSGMVMVRGFTVGSARVMPSASQALNRIPVSAALACTVTSVPASYSPLPLPFATVRANFSTGASVTVTVASPDLVRSSVEVATTVRVSAVSSAATVRRPSVVMVVPSLSPRTVQVTVWAGLFSPMTEAVNCCVPPCCTLAAAGDTVTFSTVGSAGASSSPRSCSFWFMALCRMAWAVVRSMRLTLDMPSTSLA